MKQQGLETAPGLSIEDLSHRYRRGQRSSLDGLSASFDSRSIAVLGPNGAGKTTLFKILALSLSPGSGSFRFGTRQLESRLSRRARADYLQQLGLMPQNLRMYPGYNCEDFLRYVCWLRRLPIREVEYAVAEALEIVDLANARHTRIRQLSGGMRQRLGLAQSLVARPQILLLDEPTVGLDPRQRVEFRDHIASINRRCTVVFATHLVDDVAALATEVLVLDGGRKVFGGGLARMCGRQVGDRVTGADVERRYLQLMTARQAS